MRRDLLRALDPVRWADEVLGWKADAVQAQLLRSGARRQLLCCTRQWGKSTTTAAKVAHRVLMRPGELVLIGAPSGRQSAELVRKIELALERAGEKVSGDGDNAISVELRNGSRIVGLPSKESTIRGFSAPGLVVIDEASKVPDSVYYATRPMLATVEHAELWLLSTPFGRRGFFWQEWEQGGPTWARVRVPAPECARISKAFLEEERRTHQDWWFRQEYLCEFVDVTDSAFNHQSVLDAVSEEVEAI